MTIPRTLTALGCTAIVALSACSDADPSPASSAAAVTIESTSPVATDPVETVPVEIVPVETVSPAPPVDIEIGAADTSVIGGLKTTSGTGSLISRRIQITNNSDVALRGRLSLNVGCPVDSRLSESMPAAADDLTELDISSGDAVSIEPGASADVFAAPIVVPDNGAPCTDGSGPVLLLNVTDLIQGDPPPTVSGTTMVVSGEIPQTFAVMELVTDAING